MQKSGWKRLWSLGMVLFFGAASLFGMPARAAAEEIASDTIGTAYDSVYYIINQLGNVVITGAVEGYSTVHIPEVIEDRVVTDIAAEAFAGNDSLIVADIPDSVTTIGDHAFYQCSNLAVVEGASAAAYVGQDILLGTRWQAEQTSDIAVLNGRIAVDVLQKVSEVSVPDGVEVLADGLFMDNTSLTEVHLPDSLIYIGDSCFAYCSGLTEIAFPSSLHQIRNGAFYECTGLLQLKLPNGVNTIGDQAFYHCTSLEQILFGSSLRTIGDSAFEKCTALRMLILPDSLTRLGSYAFSECTSMYILVLQGKLTEIPAYAFSECKMLEYAAISDSVTKIDFNAFSSCTSLRALNLPTALLEIGAYAFSMCTNLTDLNLPDTVESVGKDAFFKTGWMEQHSGTWKICDGVLLEYSGTAQLILIPQTVRVIGSGFLANQTGVTRVTLPLGMSNVADGAFQGCDSIQQVDLSDTVTNIGSCAFQDCTSLEKVTKTDYIDTIADGAFEGCTALKEITLPEGLASLGMNAFRDCSSLQTLLLPSTLTEIQDQTFYGCTALVNNESNCMLENSGITKIGSQAFANCSSLIMLTFPDTLQSVAADSFIGCNGVTFTFLGMQCEIPQVETSFPEQSTLQGFDGSSIQQYAEKFQRQFRMLDAPMESATTTEVKITTVTTITKTAVTTAATTATPKESVTMPPFITAEATVTTVNKTETYGSTTIVIASTIPEETLTETCIESTMTTDTETKTELLDSLDKTEAYTTLTSTTAETTMSSVSSDLGSGTELVLGDVDGDGRIDTMDAYHILLTYANIHVGNIVDWDAAAQNRMDVDQDGVISTFDAYYVLRYYALYSVGYHPIPFEQRDWSNPVDYIE